MPIIEQLQKKQPYYWENPHRLRWEEAEKQLSIQPTLIDDAEARLQRFAPYFIAIEPTMKEANGLIESPIQQAKSLQEKYVHENEELWLKRDDILPIAGSIKARGGIHEVLTIAEQLAISHGLIESEKDYAQFTEPSFHELFSKYTIVVGSTGNLGLSIGIMSAKLGFRVVVHMSHDAKQWKKDLLREKGVTVVEHTGDYSKAVEQGRKEAEADSFAFFIDDENSQALFSGYAVAARRLKKQLEEANIHISIENPLAVYLPCGVGGGPGGVAYGLKTIFGDAVHCYFVEPVESPCMLLGMATEQHHDISVQDIGLSNQTAADGLAVGRASKFVGQLMMPILHGIVTVTDDQLYRMVYELKETEGLQIEPSAAAGIVAIGLIQAPAAYHVAWLTGGGMVPQSEWQKFYENGENVDVQTQKEK